VINGNFHGKMPKSTRLKYDLMKNGNVHNKEGPWSLFDLLLYLAQGPSKAKEFMFGPITRGHKRVPWTGTLDGWVEHGSFMMFDDSECQENYYSVYTASFTP
jgi:hypothetical protein